MRIIQFKVTQKMNNSNCHSIKLIKNNLYWLHRSNQEITKRIEFSIYLIIRSQALSLKDRKKFYRIISQMFWEIFFFDFSFFDVLFSKTKTKNWYVVTRVIKEILGIGQS